jgi:glycosyltransferase involved in cell wall biosynthesis
MKTPVSCIVPFFRPNPAFLRSAVASVIAQSFKDIELVLVDDGSPEDTSWVDTTWSAHGRIVRKPNGGPASARNAGIAASKGEAVAFLDADDEWLSDKVERQLEVLRRHPEVGLVYSQVLRIDPGGRDLGVAPETVIAGAAFRSLLEHNVIPTSTVMVRRTVLDECGVFPEDPSLQGAEDYDLWLRIAERHQIACLPEPSTRYRLHPDGHSRNPHRAYGAEKRVLENAAARSHGALTDDLKPRLHRLYFEYGHELFSDDQYAEARQQFMRAIVHDPRRLRAWVYLASSFAGKPVLAPARRLLQRLRGRS